MKKQAFAREHRLPRRRDFLRVYEQGRKAHGRLVVIFCLGRNQQEIDVSVSSAAPVLQTWRVGLTATRKVGNSVKRNLMRRRAREFFRCHGDQLPPRWDIVVNLKGSAATATQMEFDQDVTRVLLKLGVNVGPPPLVEGASDNADQPSA